MLFHNGATGGFRSFIAVVREAGVGVVVLSNCPRSVDAIGVLIVDAITNPPNFYPRSSDESSSGRSAGSAVATDADYFEAV